MAIYNILAILLLLFLPLKSSSQSTVQPNADEQKLLLTIKKDWGNPASLSLWSNTGVWTGVICSSTGQVTALFLPSFHIAKPIPASICSLKNLTSIDLSYNNLTGDFPTVLYACSALELLDLSNNQLSGRLPDDIDKLSSEMQHLNLSNNGFNIGVVPSAIGRLSKLKSLQLDTNSFINNVSYPGAAIGGLAELDTPALASNPFKPDLVPKEFAMVSKLKTLWLSGRQFTLLGITKWVLKEMVAILMNIAFISGSIWLLFLRLRNRRWRDLSPLAMENGSLEEWFDCDEPFDRKMLCENARRRQGEDVQLYRRAAAPRLEAEGTLDYCCLHLPRDPDAASRSQYADTEVSEKVDGYSFVVVLLEIVTGKVVNDQHGHLTTWAKAYLNTWARHGYDDKLFTDDVLDNDIASDAARYLKEMKAVFKLGVECTMMDPQRRPSMQAVLRRPRQCALWWRRFPCFV